MYNTKLHFHFTGIGGTGMSGIAEILINLGFKVSGSDAKLGPVTKRLGELGAVICQGHQATNVPAEASLLVYSSAVRQENPELVEARHRGIPVIRRAEVLAELMRMKYGVAVAGSHGKTTTTSMTAAILEEGGLDPTAIIGGIVKSTGSGGKLGKGEFLVAESDESDKSFLLLKPSIAIVTNIDYEHLNAYSSFSELEQSFEQFVRAVPFYGLSIFCLDDPRVRDLASSYSGRKTTYGVSPDADIRPANIVQKKNSSTYDVLKNGKLLCSVTLNVPGRHIVINSLAAIAVGLELNISPETISRALGKFTGVGRRLETVGEVSGITVMNDYGHHPTEVRATLKAIREGWGSELGTFHVIFQPHRYSRTKECFAEFLSAFQDCDKLYLTDIYAASEDPIEGISGQLLFDAVVHPTKQFIKELEDVVPQVLSNAKAGDVILCLGAGSVGTLPVRFIEELKAVHERLRC